MKTCLNGDGNILAQLKVEESMGSVNDLMKPFDEFKKLNSPNGEVNY